MFTDYVISYESHISSDTMQPKWYTCCHEYRIKGDSVIKKVTVLVIQRNLNDIHAAMSTG